MAACHETIPGAAAQADTLEHLHREADSLVGRLRRIGVGEGASTRRLVGPKGHLRVRGAPFAVDASSEESYSGLVEVRPTLQQRSGTPLVCPQFCRATRSIT